MHKIVSQKKYIRSISINVVFKKNFTSLISRASKHAYVFMCAREGSFMHARIPRRKCIFTR